VQARKLQNIRSTGDTFKAIALERYPRQAPKCSACRAERTLRQLEHDLFPLLVERQIANISSMEFLRALHTLEGRGSVQRAAAQTVHLDSSKLPDRQKYLNFFSMRI
jgi:hypothetical protein